MDRIQLEFSFREKNGNKSLWVESRESALKGFGVAYLLSEIGEGLLQSSSTQIRFDWKALEFVNSSCLGAFMNLSEKAENLGKKVIFLFSSKVRDMVIQAGMGDVIPMEME